MQENTEEKQSENNDENVEVIRQKIFKQLQHRIGQDGKPLTVAVIGTPGAGKSSFINTIITSITKEWRNYVEVGHYGGLAITKTQHLRSFYREKYLEFAEDKSELLKYNFPTLIDMAGFTDAKDETTRKLLDLIFSGRIPLKGKISNVDKNIQYNKENVDEVYPCKEEIIKVDRIIFVVSASNESPPKNLMQSLCSSVTSGPRAIPVFGVITKIDKPFAELEKGDFKAFVSKFKFGLGILDINMLQCVNYCDENLKDIQRGIRTHLPSIDTPVLQFLMQVLDPVQEVIDNEEYEKKHGHEFKVPEEPFLGACETNKNLKKEDNLPKRRPSEIHTPEMHESEMHFSEMHSSGINISGIQLSWNNLGEYLMVAIFVLLFAVIIILIIK